MKLTPRSIALLFLLTVVATIAKGQFSTTNPGEAQDTQARGYRTDLSTNLMWVARDNGERVRWHKAAKYCRNLKLAGYSDWRLATIEELEGLVNRKAYATEHVGYSDILHWNGNLLVNGGLALTYGRQWSGTPVIGVDGRPLRASFWYFDFTRGVREKGFEDIVEGDTMQALCVRNINPAPSTLTNQGPELKSQAMASWTDSSTALTWTATDNGKDVNLGEALQYCRDLRLEQHSDWRLAKIDELEALRRSDSAVAETAGKPEDQAASYRLPGELSLTGDQWSGTPVSEDRGFSSNFEWYLGLNSETRVFDEPGYSHVRRALCVRNSSAQPAPRIDALAADVRSSSEDQTSTAATQQRGYWFDPSTKLMWAARDNLGNFIASFEATRYCHDLRLARHSDWRLATIEELRGIYDPKAESPGEIPRSSHQEPEPLLFHVKGNLFLSGMQWGTTGQYDPGEPGKVWGFDFQHGKEVDDSHRLAGRRALCVRHSSE